MHRVRPHVPKFSEPSAGSSSSSTRNDGTASDECEFQAIPDTERGAQTVEYGSDTRELRYRTYGDTDGEPLVFLHGTPGSRLLGALFDTAAREQGLRVIAPDRPGFGQSTDWSNRRPADASEWVEPLLADATASSARVVAFSGGSADALTLAGTRPDLVERVDLVSGSPPPTVAADTPGLQRTLGHLAARAPRILGAAFRGQRWAAERGDPETVLQQYTDEPADIPAGIADLIRRDFLESCRRSRNGTVTELSWVVGGWGIRPTTIECPVRLWHGTNDENVPLADAERLCGQITDGRLTTVDGDHLTTLLQSREHVLASNGPRD